MMPGHRYPPSDEQLEDQHRQLTPLTSNQGVGWKTAGGPSVIVRNAGRCRRIKVLLRNSKNVTDKMRTSSAATYFGAKKLTEPCGGGVWWFSVNATETGISIELYYSQYEE
jgi:hypothetical protein